MEKRPKNCFVIVYLITRFSKISKIFSESFVIQNFSLTCAKASHLHLNVLFLANMDVLAEVEVEYITLPGWKTPIKDARSFDQLPKNAQAYVHKIQEVLGIPGKCFAFLYMH